MTVREFCCRCAFQLVTTLAAVIETKYGATAYHEKQGELPSSGQLQTAQRSLQTLTRKLKIIKDNFQVDFRAGIFMTLL